MASETLSPDALLVQTNLSGAVTDIDEDPDSPDSAWLTTNDAGSDTVARTSFPSPTSNPSTGAGLQEFRVLLRRTANSNREPTATVSLYEGGTLVADLVTNQAIASTSGEVVSATWDATNLSTADGSGVEVRVEGSRTGGPGNQRNTVEVGAVEWNAEIESTSQQLTKSVTVTATASAGTSQTKSLLRSASATSTGSGAVATTKSFFRSAVALAVGSTVVNQIKSLLRSAAVSTSASVGSDRIKSLLRSLSATATGSPTVNRLLTSVITKTVSAVASVSAGALRTLSLLRSVAATSSANATTSQTKSLLRSAPVSAFVSATLSRTKSLFRSTGIVATVVNAIERALTLPESVAASATGSASVSRNVTKTGSGSTSTRSSSATASAAATVKRKVQMKLGVRAPDWSKTGGVRGGPLKGWRNRRRRDYAWLLKTGKLTEEEIKDAFS